VPRLSGQSIIAVYPASTTLKKPMLIPLHCML
jgi:hypothetical protein